MASTTEHSRHPQYCNPAHEGMRDIELTYALRSRYGGTWYLESLLRGENYMRKLMVIVLLAAATACAQTGGAPKQEAAPGKAAPSKAKVLNRAELDELLSHPDRVLLLDLRRPDEISTIGGFPVYLSIQIGELEKHLSEIPKDRVIVTVSNHAGRAGRAADLLGSKGFKVAGAVGAETYESEGGKLLKIEPPKPAAEKK